jgi:hypothetical protein
LKARYPLGEPRLKWKDDAKMDVKYALYPLDLSSSIKR